MGRELQKKKNRSSISKVKHKPKSKRLQVKGNTIVAQNWDKHLTLAQNYQRLGLVARLKGRSGGVERFASDIKSTDNIKAQSSDPLDVRSQRSQTPAVARIERNPVTGENRVVRSEPERDNPLNDPLNEITEDSSLRPDQSNEISEAGGIIRELEEQAKYDIKKRPRQQSQREEEWLAALHEKHGENYGAMFRDQKLNLNQQSEGDLKRRITTWLARKRD
ncbi:Nucleolar protein 16 [Agyrium rufum]|nr:Nucleolar protein 16 [Agyrium rufum]